MSFTSVEGRSYQTHVWYGPVSTVVKLTNTGFSYPNLSSICFKYRANIM